MYETSTGPPETFFQKVGLRHEAAGSGKEAGVTDRPSLNSKTVGGPGHEVIALFLIFGLFLSTMQTDCPDNHGSETRGLRCKAG
jgi:hypothetical protein